MIDMWAILKVYFGGVQAVAKVDEKVVLKPQVTDIADIRHSSAITFS